MIRLSSQNLNVCVEAEFGERAEVSREFRYRVLPHFGLFVGPSLRGSCYVPA